MKRHFIGGAVVAALTVALTTPAANAEKATFPDKRGEVDRLDLAAVKLNNGDNRLAVTFRITKKSMRDRGRVVAGLGYRHPKVQYALRLTWSKRHGLRAKVLRARRQWRPITKRCDVSTWRHANRLRIGVDQSSCFRKDAGAARFMTRSESYRTSTPLDGRPLTYSKPIPRG